MENLKKLLQGSDKCEAKWYFRTLHYPNEAARHKLLDVVGDLALIGTKIKVDNCQQTRTFCKYTVC
jgi:hypothetical protein